VKGKYSVTTLSTVTDVAFLPTEVLGNVFLELLRHGLLELGKQVD
jgi:hypothetical protein